MNFVATCGSHVEIAAARYETTCEPHVATRLRDERGDFDVSTGLLLADDFLFISRVQGHARALGLEVRSVRTPEVLLAKAADEKPACVLIDVHVAGTQIAETVAALKALEPPPKIVAYGSHVAAAALSAARDAGCDLVMPNSKFVESLASDLTGWMSR